MSELIILSKVIKRNISLENEILRVSSVRTLKKGDIISLPEDSLDGMYYIRKGCTKHFMVSSTGTEKVLYKLSEGWLFGEPSFIIKKSTVLFSYAHDDTEIWKLDADTCTKLINTNEAFRNLLLDCLSYKVLYLRQEQESYCFDSCKERLLRTLVTIVDETRVVDNNWYSLLENYSHYELSVLINCARVTVTKLIKELCDENLIRIVNHRIQFNLRAYKKIFHDGYIKLK